MSSQQVGEIYYKVGIKGLQEALKDLDKLYEKSGKAPSSSSPFNTAQIDPLKTTVVKSVAEARKHLQDLANGIGVDLNRVVSQVGKMPDLMLKEARARGISPAAAYNQNSRNVSVNPGVTTVQSLKHELMHAIERLTPKDIFSSIVSGFSPIRAAEISHRNSGFIKDRMQPHEVFASFMERQSPDIIRALIGSDMATKVAALAGSAAARATVASMSNRSPATVVGGFGTGVGVGPDYGRGTRTIANTATLPPSSLSTRTRPNPDDFGATTNAPSAGDDFGAGVLTPAQKARATAAANAANARASQVQANIAAFMGSSHVGFAGGGGFGGGGGSGGGPTGPISIPNPQFNSARPNPWLVNIDRTRSRRGHQALYADAAEASEMAGEISGQVFNYDMNTDLRRARRNVLREYRTPGSTGSDLTTRQNELVDLQEKAVHLASRRAEIEGRVNSMLGTQVDYSHKIAAEEEAALNFARQRMGRDLTQSEERGIREDTRDQSMRAMLGNDASGTSGRLTSIQKELDDLRSARPGATTNLAAQMDKRIRDLREEASILVRREHLLRRQAELEGMLASGGGTWNDRRRARRELGRVQTDLVQNEIVGENARRHAAGQRSRNANYRMQELSYGVQDFAQVLSGGGGLDAALRAANNNISQFFAAAGGPNAARYSLMATVGVLGIAAAMKYLSDQTDLPIKKLEELTERMKSLQQARSQAAKIAEGGITGFGDITGGNASSISSSMGGLSLGIRNRQELLGNQIDIFGGRQRVGFGGELANVGRYSIAGLAGAVGLSGTKNEFLSKIAGSDLGTAFYERFSEGKSAKEMASLTGAVPPEMKRFFDAITKSRGTNASEAVRVFKEIDQGGGWADAKNQEEVDKLRKTIQELDADLIRLKSSAHAFDLSVAEMVRNLDRRNASLGANTSGQAQFAARSDDVRFINEARSQIRQKEGLAKYWESEGRADVAKGLREENDRQEKAIKSRLGSFGPGNSGFFTEQAASFENATSSLNEGIKSADEFRSNATTLAEQIEAARQQRAARDNADRSVGNLISGHRFNGQRANESFMEADRELSDSYLQMLQSINKTLNLKTNAGRRAKEGLDRAKKQEDELRASARLYERDVSDARASGTSFDEQRAAIEKDRNERLAKAEKDYFDDPIALKKERDLVNRGANRRLNDNLRNEERNRIDVANMFAGQAGSLIGGRDGQHYANAQQLQANLRAIEDAKAADPNMSDADVKKKRQEAQTIFEETAKQIEHKQVGFSDIGGMWKQIQMSLKPDKSLELYKITNKHLEDIRDMAKGAGLKVQFGLGP